MRVFSAFQVQDGINRTDARQDEGDLHAVPIVYGNMSRVIATHIQRKDSLSSNRIPLLAANLTTIQMDPENQRSKHHQENIIRKDIFDQEKNVTRIIGPAFNLNMELSIYASSTDELFQILEQILLIFNPRVTIQADTNILNSDFITEISLESIDNEITYPMGMQSQIVMQTLRFVVPGRLRYPYGTTGGIIDQIELDIFHLTQEEFTDDNLKLEEMVITEGKAERANDN